MSKLHFEIFDPQQFEIFHRLPDVVERGYLVGGTALALQIGHRRSYDFDIALPDEVSPTLLKTLNTGYSDFRLRTAVDSKAELTLILHEATKLTFFAFPFPPLHPPVSIGTIPLYSLADLASNKAYVLGRMGEWKDYVDLYFLLEHVGLKLKTILSETSRRFAGNFDEKLFWEQLVYWKDLRDFEIEYLGKSVSKDKLQEYFRKLVQRRFRR